MVGCTSEAFLWVYNNKLLQKVKNFFERPLQNKFKAREKPCRINHELVLQLDEFCKQKTVRGFRAHEKKTCRQI